MKQSDQFGWVAADGLWISAIYPGYISFAFDSIILFEFPKLDGSLHREGFHVQSQENLRASQLDQTTYSDCNWPPDSLIIPTVGHGCPRRTLGEMLSQTKDPRLGLELSK